MLAVKESKALPQKFGKSTKDVLKVCSGIYFALYLKHEGILLQLADRSETWCSY
jgi:hypothetical protein